MDKPAVIERVSRGTGSFFMRYRPLLFAEMLPSTNIQVLKTAMSKASGRVFLFHGPYGTGKSVSARICAAYLLCENPDIANTEPCLTCPSCQSVIRQNNMDVMEINAGTDGSKDSIGRMVAGLPTVPFSGRYKILIIEEAHLVTKEAQQSLLNALDNLPSHVYFFFVTSEYNKVNPALKQRAFTVEFRLLGNAQLKKLVEEVCVAEHPQHTSISEKRPDLLDDIVLKAAGSARVALQNLEMVFAGGTNFAESVPKEEVPEEIRTIYGFLRDKSWNKLAPFLRGMDNLKSDSEGIRIRLASYARACLLSDQAHMTDHYRILRGLLYQVPAQDSHNAFVAAIVDICYPPS